MTDNKDGATTEMNMSAYYYEFEKTNVLAVDKILSSVAIAGKAHHHTAEWSDPDSNYGNGSLISLIQNSADDAANEIKSLRAENERMRNELKRHHEKIIHTNEFPPQCGVCKLISGEVGK